MVEMRTIRKRNPSSDTHQLAVGRTNMARIALERVMPPAKAHRDLGQKKSSLYLNTNKKLTLAGVNGLVEFKRDTCRPQEPRHRSEHVEKRSQCIRHGRRNGSSRKKRVPALCRVKERRSSFPRRPSLRIV